MATPARVFRGKGKAEMLFQCLLWFGFGDFPPLSVSGALIYSVMVKDRLVCGCFGYGTLLVIKEIVFFKKWIVCLVTASWRECRTWPILF